MKPATGNMYTHFLFPDQHSLLGIPFNLHCNRIPLPSQPTSSVEKQSEKNKQQKKKKEKTAKNNNKKH